MVTRFFQYLIITLSIASTSIAQDQLYMDADRITIKPKAGIQEFNGNVIFVGGDVMITADHISLDMNSKEVRARDKVVVVTSNQVFLGDGLTLNQQTGLFELENSSYIANAPQIAKKYIQLILGFSPEELDFEKKQLQLLQEIEKKKLDTAYSFHLKKNDGSTTELQPLKDEYKNLVYKQDLIANQYNPELAPLKSKLAESIKKRRDFWKNYKFRSKFDFQESNNKEYFKIKGKKISRTSLKEYKMQDSYITPCFCDEDETPDWSFSASEITAHKGGYATLNNSIFKIKNLPILYIPYLKIPIKDKRQSGFLLPSYSWNKNSGSIVEVPFYIAIDKNKDATLSTSFISDRGLLLDAEYRYKKATYSEWNFSSRIIKDKKWQDDIAKRKVIDDIYTAGLENARNSNTPATTFDSEASQILGKTSLPSYWSGIGEDNCINGSAEEQQECDQQLKSYSTTPNNLWRYDLKWNGLDLFNKNLKLKSVGSVISDHRVEEDFFYSTDYTESLITQSYAKTFSRSASEFVYQNESVYTNLGFFIGDYLSSFKSYSGYQLPLNFSLDTKLFQIPTPKKSPLSLYTQSHLNFKKIQLWDNQDSNKVLGNGSWGRLKQSLVLNLNSLKILNINLFGDTELRAIRHENLDQKSSTILSSKYGVELSLPMDGFIHLNRGGLAPKSLQHFMDWKLRFSARPSIKRDGLYASASAADDVNGYGKSYFITDLDSSSEQIEEAVRDEDRMLRHRRITLETSHAFKLYESKWSNVPTYQKKQTSDYPERAQKELAFFDDSWSKMSKGEELPANNLVPQIKQVYTQTPLLFSAKTEYDFVDKKIQDQQKKQNVPLDEQVHPWKDLETNLAINSAYFSFSNTMKYDFKLKNLRNQQYALWSPTIFESRLGLGFQVEKGAVFYDEKNELKSNKVTTQTLSFKSDILPRIHTEVSLGKRKLLPVDQKETTEYQSQYSIGYTPLSNCWGVRFVRTKPYDRREKDANYLLELQVNFAGQSRSLPNMSRPIAKLFSGETE